MQFRSRAEVRKYFGGKTVKCLLCEQRFQRLGRHLIDRHEITADIYKRVFGIPWTQSLACLPSRRRTAASWNQKRKAKARKIAHKTRFFKLAHAKPRRNSPAYILRELTANLHAG
jgi:hypothetical protein